jgi:hypothetical protein
MNIEFIGPVVSAPDGGISYRVLVNGETVACRVSMEALQDIDPERRQDDPISQFNAHSSILLSIAEQKIRNGNIEDNVVWVFTGDL